MSETKYPDVHVQLSGEDGNSYSIIGRVRKALKRAGVSDTEVDEFSSEATRGDYDNLLRTAMKWVSTS